MYILVPLTQKITSSAHCLHLLPCWQYLSVRGFLLPPQAGLLFLFFTTLLKVTQLTPGLSKGSLMFAELHSDARVRPKLASEEFSGCGPAFSFNQHIF